MGYAFFYVIATAFAMGHWQIGLVLVCLLGYQIWGFFNEHEGLRIYPDL